MNSEYMIVNNQTDKNGNQITEFIQFENKILIKHYTGVNTDNYLLKKADGKNIQFSLFKLNNIYYVNINGQHIIDYRKFTSIQKITTKENDVLLKNIYIGELVLNNCDIEIIHKALEIMADWMKKRKSWYSDFIYWIFN